MHPITGEVLKNAPHMMEPHVMGEMMRPAMYVGGGYMAARAIGGGVIGSLLRNPLVLLAAGVALGYLAHRYRKEILLAASKASGAGKDFLLQQKESLADVLAEAREAEEQAAKAAAERTPPETKPGA